MPFILAVLGALAAAYFWMNRAKGAAHLAGDLADMAGDVMSAARRFGFRRKANIHPAESIEDPKLAMAGVAVAFLELDDLPSKEAQSVLNIQLRKVLRLSEAEAEELMILGRWFMSECGGPDPAISRLSRKLFKLDGAAGLEPLMSVLQGTLAANGLNDRQRDALDDIKRAFRLT